MVVGYLAWINLILGIFNLVPGFPLDGGRLLRAFLWWKTGSLTRATKVASDFGKGFAVAIMILGGVQIFAGDLINGLWFIFIGMFLRGMSSQGYEELVIRKALEGVHVDEVMVREVVTVPPGLSISQLIHDYFLHYAFRGFPVTDNGRVLGVVSVTGVRQLPREEYDVRRVAEIMTPLTDESWWTAGLPGRRPGEDGPGGAGPPSGFQWGPSGRARSPKPDCCALCRSSRFWSPDPS